MGVMPLVTDIIMIKTNFFEQLSIQLQVNDARVCSYSIIYAMTLCASTILSITCMCKL